MNSYFLAIQQATSNVQFPELADAWRNYHPEAILSDSDYQFMTDQQEALLSDPLPSYLMSIYF